MVKTLGEILLSKEKKFKTVLGKKRNNFCETIILFFIMSIVLLIYRMYY